MKRYKAGFYNAETDQVERVVTLKGHSWRSACGIAAYLNRLWPDQEWATPVLVVWDAKGKRTSVQLLDDDHPGLGLLDVGHIGKVARSM